MRKPKRKSVALVRQQRRATLARQNRQRKRTMLARVERVDVLPVPAGAPAMLTSDPVMAATFVGTFNLEQKQIDALRRPIADSEVSWRAAKQDGPEIIPYLSHNGYRDRLDAAFGLGGWGMLPVGQPKQMDGGFIYVPYAFVVGGAPRIYAWGEQQIHKMTYGDALEGCKSNAIVRCGKELGIARELWDKKYVDELLKRKGRGVPANGSTRAADPRSGYNAREAEPITDGQRKRLFVIVQKSGRTEFEVRRFLKEMFGLDSTKTIKRGDYEAICQAIEKPGDLPRPPAMSREPGEEG